MLLLTILCNPSCEIYCITLVSINTSKQEKCSFLQMLAEKTIVWNNLQQYYAAKSEITVRQIPALHQSEASMGH